MVAGHFWGKRKIHIALSTCTCVVVYSFGDRRDGAVDAAYIRVLIESVERVIAFRGACCLLVFLTLPSGQNVGLPATCDPPIRCDRESKRLIRPWQLPRDP